MAKHFVYQGLEFQTVQVTATQLGGSGGELVDACTLESVVTALGTDVVADVATIRGWWTETGITDSFQRLAREVLNSNGPLVTDPQRGQGESADSNFHRLASAYILPPQLANAIADVPASNADASRARTRLIVKSLSVRHDNIIKHSSSELAWQAWTAHFIAAATQIDNQLAKAGYFITPT